MLNRSIQLCILLLVFANCTNHQKTDFKPVVLLSHKNLVITQISDNAYEHTTYLQTNDFGKVPCNGLIVSDADEAIVFDTPASDQDSELLIKWITEKLRRKIKAIIPTHFHNDCLGGLKAFHDHGIPSYASWRTIELARKGGAVVPINGFKESLTLKVGNKDVLARFFGEGHTKDNVVGYFPEEAVLFGGCLIKELTATKGFFGDANVSAWSETVEKVKAAYPNVQTIVPGHGAYGDKRLLDYTIGLFSPNSTR